MLENRALVGDLQERRDRQLLERITERDESAFSELFSRYAGAALGLAQRTLRDKTIAEEVTQETFLSIWRKPESYDEARGTVRSWLLTQVHHKAIDVIRHENAQRKRTMSAPLPISEDRGPEDVVEEEWLASRRKQVRSALTNLPKDHLDILQLTYFDGMTQAEAAEKLGIPLGTVKSRTVAAMKRLHRVLRVGVEGA